MPGPKRRRPTHRSSMFDFSVLEPRQLLSVSLPAGVNLVNNSTFVPITEVDSQLYSNEAVEGWTAVNSDAGQQLNLLKFPHEREFVLNLDSTADHFDQVFQDIATQADVEYVLAFDLRERPVGGEAGEITNDLQVFWNDQSVGTFRGTHQWQKIVLSVTGQADTTRLEFREVAGGDQDLGDGRGPLIDNVSLVNNRPGSLANGSFQTGEDASSNNLYHQSKVAGWGAMGSYDDRVIQIIQSDQATDGSYLDLDSSKEHLDRLYQDLATESGRKYFLSFDIKGADVADADNELRVRWNDQWAGTFFGRDQWQTYGLLLEADSDLTRLVLRETPNGELGAGDGHGPLLDNIRLVGIDTARELMVVDANGLAEGTDSNALYSGGAGPTLITTSELSVQNRLRDSLTSAVIEFDARLDGSNEFLSVDVGSSQLTSSYDVPTGVLLLSGTGSVAVYSEVLQTLRYDNTADEVTGGNREVSITLHSDDAKSAATVITVNVQSENEAPEISPIGDPLVTLGNDFQLTVNASDPNNDPLTYEISSFGEPVSGNSIQPTISSTGEISWSPQRDGILTVTVTVTDDAGASAFRDFSITVARNADVPNDFEAFSGNRQLSNVTPELRNQLYDQAPEMSIDTEKVYEAIFHTADGDIRVLLNDDEAPITVNNFVNLARDGFYDGLTFHRVISLGPGFIAQGGDPTGFGSGGPGYRFDDEATAMTDFDRRDLLAMANAGADTNGSQFFFTLSPQTHLNGRHAIFGEVIEGSDVVDAINQRDVGSATPAEKIYSVSILEDGSDFVWDTSIYFRYGNEPYQGTIVPNDVVFHRSEDRSFYTQNFTDLGNQWDFDSNPSQAEKDKLIYVENYRFVVDPTLDLSQYTLGIKFNNKSGQSFPNSPSYLAIGDDAMPGEISGNKYQFVEFNLNDAKIAGNVKSGDDTKAIKQFTFIPYDQSENDQYFGKRVVSITFGPGEYQALGNGGIADPHSTIQNQYTINTSDIKKKTGPNGQLIGGLGWQTDSHGNPALIGLPLQGHFDPNTNTGWRVAIGGVADKLLSMGYTDQGGPRSDQYLYRLNIDERVDTDEQLLSQSIVVQYTGTDPAYSKYKNTWTPILLENSKQWAVTGDGDHGLIDGDSRQKYQPTFDDPASENAVKEAIRFENIMLELQSSYGSDNTMFHPQSNPTDRSIAVAGVTFKNNPKRNQSGIQLNFNDSYDWWVERDDQQNNFEEIYSERIWQAIGNHHGSNPATKFFNNQGGTTAPVWMFDNQMFTWVNGSDGPEVRSPHSHFERNYQMTPDDNLKVLSSWSTWNDMTLIQGNTGSAVSFASYGFTNGAVQGNHLGKIAIPRIAQAEQFDGINGVISNKSCFGQPLLGSGGNSNGIFDNHITQLKVDTWNNGSVDQNGIRDAGVFSALEFNAMFPEVEIFTQSLKTDLQSFAIGDNDFGDLYFPDSIFENGRKRLLYAFGSSSQNLDKSINLSDVHYSESAWPVKNGGSLQIPYFVFDPSGTEPRLGFIVEYEYTDDQTGTTFSARNYIDLRKNTANYHW